MDKNNSKQKVLRAAVDLFYQKGFHATSVRDIADRAGVNLSLISYYFDGKQGLFEHALVYYYENYLKEVEKVLDSSKDLTALEQLKKMIFSIIKYKQENKKYSCFIHRELTVDSTFIREVFSTYIAKENYLVKTMFFKVIDQRNMSSMKKELLYMQFKGMLAIPYLHQREFHQTLYHHSGDKYFVKNYTEILFSWLETIIIDK